MGTKLIAVPVVLAVWVLSAACTRPTAPVAANTPGPAQGALEQLVAPDGRTIFFPTLPPSDVSMTALLEGVLVEADGCLRVRAADDAPGFLVLWPHDAGLHVANGVLEVRNGLGQVIARVGAPVRMGGGAMESPGSQANYDRLVPGLPLPECPGPYWVAGPLETLEEQAIPDVYVDPYTSGGRMLALFLSQSRPSAAEGAISGELQVDGQGCMRVAGFTVLWPPEVYIREEPLRLVTPDDQTIVRVGEAVRITGGEKRPEDYRFFADKVRCPAPYWGAAEVTAD